MEERAYQIIDLDSVIDASKYVDKGELLAKDRAVYSQMLEEAVRSIKLAKLLHDDMEKSYVGNMDFVERIKTILKNK